MPTNQWIGDCAAQTQIERVEVLATRLGSTCRIIINGKAAVYTVSEAAANDRAAVAAELSSAVSALIAANTSLTGMTVSSFLDDDGNIIGIDITGASGVPFTFDASGAVRSTVTELSLGRAAKNNIQIISLPGVPTAGTFTLTYFGQTTAGLAYNASAATVQSALEGLSSIGTGNVSVTGSAGGPWTVEWIGDFLGRDPEDTPQLSGGAEPTGLITIDATGVTQSAYGAYCRVVQRGGGRRNCKQFIRVLGTPTAGSMAISYSHAFGGAFNTGTFAWNVSAATLQTTLQGFSSIGSGNVVVSGSIANGFLIEFVGDLAGKKIGRLNVDLNAGSGFTGTAGAAATVVRTVQGPEVYGPGAALITHPALLVAPTSTSTVPVAIVARITHPKTKKQYEVGWKNGDAASTVQAAFAAVPDLGTYGVTATKVDDGYRLDITGLLSTYTWSVDEADEETANVGVIRILRGGAASIIQNYAAGAAAAEWRARIPAYSATISMSGPSFGASATTTFASDATIATIQTALDTANIWLTVSEGGASVTKAYRELVFTYDPEQGFGIDNTSPAPAQDIYLSTTGTIVIHCESLMIQQGDEGTNTIHELGYIGYPGGGTTSLKAPGDTAVTATIGTEAADINTAIALTEVREIRRDPTTNSVWLEWYGANYHGLDVELLEITGNALSGTIGIVSLLQVAQPQVEAEQQIEIRNATGGTFTVTLEGQTTSAIAWNAEPGMLQTALEALSNVAPGDVVVYGSAGGPWRVVFLSTYATGPDVDLMTVDITSLTADAIGSLSSFTTQEATGPEHFDNADNWSLGRIPATSDTLLFTRSNRSCRYGIDQSSITPSYIYFDASYTGEIGLPDYLNDSAVTLTKELTLGTNGAGTMTIEVGRGEGAGSSRIRLNTGGKQTLLRAWQTGTATDEPAALQWRGTHASNVVEIYRGTFGCGLGLEAATISELRMGYLSAQESDALALIGEGVTLTTVNKSGGVAFIDCALTTLTNTAGEITIGGVGAVTTIIGSGGIVYYNSSGTLTNATMSNGALLSFERDMRPKTVSNPINIHGDESDVLDTFQVVSSLQINYNRTTRQPGLGTNYRVARTVL